MTRFALLLPFLASCAADWRVVNETPSEPPGTDEAVVIVYRESYRNATKPYAFLDDEEILGFSLAGSWFEVRVAPGDHFFVLHGVSSAGVRATLEAGRTYFLRADSVPRFLHLELRLTPIVPGMREFDEIDRTLAGLDRVDPVDVLLAEFAENHAEDLEEALASLKTDRYDQCPVLGPDAGRKEKN